MLELIEDYSLLLFSISHKVYTLNLSFIIILIETYVPTFSLTGKASVNEWSNSLSTVFKSMASLVERSDLIMPIDKWILHNKGYSKVVLEVKHKGQHNRKL